MKIFYTIFNSENSNILCIFIKLIRKLIYKLSILNYYNCKIYFIIIIYFYLNKNIVLNYNLFLFIFKIYNYIYLFLN